MRLNLGDVIHVDYVNGVNVSCASNETICKYSCGSSETPCKYLHQGMNIIETFGKILITGEQPLSSSINITKNVSIECSNRGYNAVISNTGNALYAFKISSSFTVHLTGLIFKDISVISMYQGSSVFVENCTVSQSKETVFRLKDDIYLYIYNSKFTNKTSYLIYDIANNSDFGREMNIADNTNVRRKRIIVKNCSLAKMNGIHLTSFHEVHLVVERSTFTSIYCPSIYLESMVLGPQQGSITVIENVFIESRGLTCRTYGVFIYLKYLKSSYISNCKFYNGYAFYRGRSVEIQIIKYSMIETCEFFNNVTNVIGGAVSIRSVTHSNIIT